MKLLKKKLLFYRWLNKLVPEPVLYFCLILCAVMMFAYMLVQALPDRSLTESDLLEYVTE